MSRYERRQYFDRLCDLRAAYARRGIDDTAGPDAPTIAATIASAELLFAELEAQAPAATEERLDHPEDRPV